MSETLEQKRDRAEKLVAAGSVALRTCHECNSAHAHYVEDEDCVIYCIIGCGRYWLGGVDLTIYKENT